MALVHLKVVKGYTSHAVYVNGTHVAGVKPFGGGIIVAQWHIDEKVLKDALKKPTTRKGK